MVSVEHQILIERKEVFRPTVIKVTCFGVTDYNPPLVHSFIEIA